MYYFSEKIPPLLDLETFMLKPVMKFSTMVVFTIFRNNSFIYSGINGIFQNYGSTKKFFLFNMFMEKKVSKAVNIIFFIK